MIPPSRGPYAANRGRKAEGKAKLHRLQDGVNEQIKEREKRRGMPERTLRNERSCQSIRVAKGNQHGGPLRGAIPRRPTSRSQRGELRRNQERLCSGRPERRGDLQTSLSKEGGESGDSQARIKAISARKQQG